MAVDRSAVRGPNGGTSRQRKVMFFDIDNCLYPKSSKVHHMASDLIDRYFATHLSLPPAEAARLHREYYTNYGLAIEGLVRHHDIDPLDFNARVDDALPLDTLIRPREELKQLLRAIDRSRVRPWLLTNAYVNHARRVVRLLGIDDQFEGMTFCDYASVPFVCKPDKAMYDKAMREAGVAKYEDCYFVDDSYINCQKAEEIGWHTTHLIEDGEELPRTPACKYQIQDIVELRRVFPELFKHKEQANEG